MPIFEYICQECQHEFEALVFGRDKARCPKCESKKLSPQLSVFAMSGKSSAGEVEPAAQRIRHVWQELGGRICSRRRLRLLR